MQSMDEIYNRYARTVYRYLLSLTRDADLSEELTQETFYQAIRSIDRFDGSCKLSTWLCAIARNCLQTWHRKNPVHEPLPEEDSESAGSAGGSAATAPSAEAIVLGGADRLDMFRRLHELPDPCREVLYLRLFGGLSFREIGEVLGRTENWARVNYYRGREKLKKEL